MSATTTKPDLKIEIAEAIRRDPDLHAAVQQANDHLEELLVQPNLDADGRELSWSLSEKNPVGIAVELSEWDRYGRREARSAITRKHLFDRDSREIFMSKLKELRSCFIWPLRDFSPSGTVRG